MADAFTGGGSGAAWDNFVETAFNQATDWFLRDMPQWRQVVDVHPTAQAMPGNVINLSLQNELTHKTSTLPETTDPDAVALPAPTRVPVTLAEYGNSAIGTEFLDALAFINANADLAQSIALNMADSMDDVLVAIARANTNRLYSTGTATTNTGVAAGGGADTGVTGTFGRIAAAGAAKILERNKVAKKQGGYYVAFIHPDCAYDFQSENSATAWVAPHTYGTDTGAIYTGVTGSFGGTAFIETTRVGAQYTDLGAGTSKGYDTFFLGAQALAGVEATPPQVRVGGTVLDKFKRFRVIAWYALAGYAVYRPQALLTVRAISSLSGTTPA
jgi:N4-gp56 family major capsid protein